MQRRSKGGSRLAGRAPRGGRGWRPGRLPNSRPRATSVAGPRRPRPHTAPPRSSPLNGIDVSLLPVTRARRGARRGVWGRTGGRAQNAPTTAGGGTPRSTGHPPRGRPGPRAPPSPTRTVGRRGATVNHGARRPPGRAAGGNARHPPTPAPSLRPAPLTLLAVGAQVFMAPAFLEATTGLAATAGAARRACMGVGERVGGWGGGGGRREIRGSESECFFNFLLLQACGPVHFWGALSTTLEVGAGGGVTARLFLGGAPVSP